MSSSAGDYKPPPSWLAEEEEVSASSSHALNAKNGSASSSGTTSGGAPNRRVVSPSVSKIMEYKPWIIWGLKMATLGLSALMLFTSLYGLSQVNGFGDMNKMFVGVYMFCFAVMLLLFEVIQLQPMVWLDHMYQRNFGFMYGIKGKGFFIIL